MKKLIYIFDLGRFLGGFDIWISFLRFDRFLISKSKGLVELLFKDKELVWIKGVRYGLELV